MVTPPPPPDAGAAVLSCARSAPAPSAMQSAAAARTHFTRKTCCIAYLLWLMVEGPRHTSTIRSRAVARSASQPFYTQKRGRKFRLSSRSEDEHADRREEHQQGRQADRR